MSNSSPNSHPFLTIKNDSSILNYMENTSNPNHLFHVNRKHVIIDVKIFLGIVIALLIGLFFYTKFIQGNVAKSRASEGSPVTTTYYPVADTYANQSNQTNSYDHKEVLITKNGNSTKKNIYLKFDLSKTANTTIAGAKLRVHVNDGSADMQYYHLITGINWDEKTLNWNNQPGVPKDVIGTTSKTQANNWVEVSFDSVAEKMQGQIVTIVISTPTGGDVFGIDSSSTTNPPQLLVTTLGGLVAVTPQVTTAISMMPTRNPQPTTKISPTVRPTDIPVPTDIPPTNGPVPTFAPVSGQTYYISPTGNDGADGKSTASPLKSFNKAMGILKPGDILYMRGGDYYENVTPKLTSGRPDAKITMKNYPGERPVIHGLFIMSSPSYWVFDGVNVTWGSGLSSGDHMTKFTGGTSWELKNCEIWGARSYAGMSITGFTTKWSIHDCIIHDTYASNSTNQDHLIYANDASYGVIEHNIFLNSPNGRGVKLGPPSGGGAGPNNITVRFNTFYNNEGPANIQVSGGTSNNTFEKNILVKPGSGNPSITVNSGYFGSNSVAKGNLCWLSSGVFESGIVDGGGNINNTIDPQINFNVSKRADGSYILDANSFRPGNAAAAAYGRYGN